MTMLTESAFGHPLADLAQRLTARRRHARIRRGLRRLQDLDAATLRDIGVERYEVDAALRLPLHLNPSVELHRMAALRRANDARARLRR